MAEAEEVSKVVALRRHFEVLSWDLKLVEDILVDEENDRVTTL